MHEQRYIEPCAGADAAAGQGGVASACASRRRRARAELPAAGEPGRCARPEAPGPGPRTPAHGGAASRVTRPELPSDVPPNMGCSLCSLQKREEQYRLLYEVCQVTAGLVPWGGGGALTWQSVTSRRGPRRPRACVRSGPDSLADFLCVFHPASCRRALAVALLLPVFEY